MKKFYVQIIKEERATVTLVVAGKDEKEAEAKAFKYWKGQEDATCLDDHDWDYCGSELCFESIEAFEEAKDELEAHIE
jgi:hypothetical protein